MSNNLQELLQNNSEWASTQEPSLFKGMAKGQQPPFLWIGCSDSRVPASVVTNQEPGQLFVHRNVANMVIHTDTNLLSVVYYAVKALKVKHIIVCGHYGCGGVAAAMGNSSIPILDSWLRNIKEVYAANSEELDSIIEDSDRAKRFVELNVAAQVANLAKLSFIQEEWASGSDAPHIHGLVFDLETGKLHDQNLSVNNASGLSGVFQYNMPSS